MRARLHDMRRLELPQALPLIAPYVNSYRRFHDEASSAPTNFAWGYDNRAMGLRVPNSRPDDRRLENRVVGVDANPYLALAASLGSGLLGMQQSLAPTKPHQGTANEDDVEVARTLEEALRKLGDTGALRDMFGELFLRAYAAVKLDEFEEFNRVISSWEREHLLLQV